MEERSRQAEESISCQTQIEDMTGFIFCNRFCEVYTPESINRELSRIIENHNSTEEVQTIVALGAGSITKKVYPDGRIARCENVKVIARYIERIGEMIERKRETL